MNELIYKGYTGRVEYDPESKTLHGTVLDLRDVITFESTSAEDIEEEFHRSVDEYLKLGAEMGRAPEKPFSGRLVLRMTPVLHRKIHNQAQGNGVSINQWIVSALEKQV